MINIGKVVYSLLSSDVTLTGYVGNKIFPIVADENTLAPIIVYERQSNQDYNKDSTGLFNTSVDITIISDTYSESIDIATRVNDIINNYSGSLFGVNVRDVELEFIDELFSDGYYIQKLTYNFKNN